MDTKGRGSAKQLRYSKGSVLLQKFNIVEVNKGVNLLAQQRVCAYRCGKPLVLQFGPPVIINSIQLAFLKKKKNATTSHTVLHHVCGNLSSFTDT